MEPYELTSEQKARLKSCKDPKELMSMLNEMGIEITDEQLEKATGGREWYECPDFGCWAYSAQN